MQAFQYAIVTAIALALLMLAVMAAIKILRIPTTSSDTIDKSRQLRVQGIASREILCSKPGEELKDILIRCHAAMGEDTPKGTMDEMAIAVLDAWYKYH